MALNLSNKKYYMVPLDGLHCLKRFLSHMHGAANFPPNTLLSCVITDHNLEDSVVEAWVEKGLATNFSSFFSVRCFRSVDIWSIICHGECLEYIELHYYFLVIHGKKKVE